MAPESAPVLNPLFDELSVGFAVFDRDLRIQSFNPTWAAAVINSTSIKPEQIFIGQNILDVMPRQKERLQTEFAKVLLGNTIHFPDPDSEEVDHEIKWRSILMPIWQQNQVISVVHLAINFNFQENHSQTPSPNHPDWSAWVERLHFVLSATTDGIWDFETASQQLYVSDHLKTMMGFTRQNAPLTVKEWFQLMDPEESDRLTAEILQAVQDPNTTAFSSENQILTRTGKKICVLTRGVILRDPDNRPWRILGSSKDITEIVTSRQALQQRIDYEKLIAKIASLFATRSDDLLDATIHETLQLVGEFFNVDRSFVFQLIENNEFLEIAYEWSRPELIQLRAMKMTLPSSEEEVAIQKLIRGETVLITFSGSSIPHEIQIRGHGPGMVTALVAVPMLHQGTVIGCIGLAQVQTAQEWNEEHTNLLKIIGEIISNALEQRKAAEFQTGQQRYLELIATQTNFSETIHSLVDLLENQYPGMRCLIFSLDAAQNRLKVVGAGRLPKPFIQAVDGLEITPYTGSAAAACLTGKRVIVEDVQNAPSWQGILPLALQHNIQGAWAEPVFTSSGELVGALSQYYPRKRGPHPSEIKTIEMAAHLAGLAIERNYAQLDLKLAYQTLENRVEERTRELTTLFKISQQISTTLDLDTLFHQLLHLIGKILEFTGASIFLLEDNTLIYRAYQGPIAESTLLGSHLHCSNEVLDRLFQSNKPEVITDTQVDSPLSRIFLDLVPVRLQQDFAYIRCWLGIPLMVQGRRIGLISLHHSQPGFYTNRHIELAATFAIQSAAAIENARLFAQTRRQVDETQAILTVQQAISSRLDPGQVMQLLADEAHQLVKADMSAFQLITGNVITITAVSGAPADLVGFQLPIDHSISGLVFKQKRTYRIHDVSDNPDLYEGILSRIKFSSLMIVPMISGLDVIGMIAVTSERVGAFSMEDERILTLLATYAVVGVENAKLYTLTKQQADESKAMLTVQRAISSRLELEDVMDMITMEAMQLTSGKMTCLSLFEQDDLVVRSIAGNYPLHLGQILPIHNSLIGLAIQNRAPLICNNTDLETKANPYLSQITGIKSIIVVPLTNFGVPLGAITSASYQEGAFTTEDERILTMLSTYAVMALENSRLYTNIRRQAEESQTLLSVQNAISSRLDPDAVMQMISDEALRLTGADQSFIYLLNGENLVLSIFSGTAPATRGFIVPLRHSISGAAVLQRRPIRVDDVLQDPRTYKPIQVLTRARSMVALPLAAGDEVFGVLVVSATNTRQFTKDDEHILNLLANNAAISLENANLYRAEIKRRQDAERRRQIAEGLREIITSLNTSRSFEEALYIITAHTCQLFRGNAAIFHQMDDELNTVAVVPYQLLEPFDGLLECDLDLLANHKPLFIPDLQQIRPRISLHFKETDQPGPISDPGHQIGIHSMLLIPIQIPQVITGNLCVFFKHGYKLSEADIDTAAIVGDQVALAIENASLRQQAEETAAAAERSRLARDLHDAVTQTLFSASLIAEVLPKIWQKSPEDGQIRLQELRMLTRGASAEMRSLLMELRPNALMEADLSEILQQLGEAFIGRARIPLEMDIQPGVSVPAEVRVVIYRVAQEALNNVIKHARASHAWLDLKQSNSRINLSIRDNGRGFNPQTTPANHYGLRIMQERADSIQAEFELQSNPGSGTLCKLVWNDPAARLEEQRS